MALCGPTHDALNCARLRNWRFSKLLRSAYVYTRQWQGLEPPPLFEQGGLSPPKLEGVNDIEQFNCVIHTLSFVVLAHALTDELNLVSEFVTKNEEYLLTTR